MSVFWVHTILMPPNLPRLRTAPWSPLLRQYTKANSVHKSWLTLLSLTIPPFWGDGQMTKTCPKFIYEYREQIPHPPGFCPFWGGYCPFWPILLSIMGKKWGDKSFILLVRIIFSHYRPWFNLFILNCRSHSLFRFIEDRSLFQLCVSLLFLFLVFNVII